MSPFHILNIFIHYVWTIECYTQEGYIKQSKIQKPVIIPTPHSFILLVNMVMKKPQHKKLSHLEGMCPKSVGFDLGLYTSTMYI
jgi:hypothetical protein